MFFLNSNGGSDPLRVPGTIFVEVLAGEKAY